MNKMLQSSTRYGSWFIFFVMSPVNAQDDAKSTGEVSGTLVSASFDFDRADLSTPANVATFAGSDSRFGNNYFSVQIFGRQAWARKGASRRLLVLFLSRPLSLLPPG
jgi:hypothetical protein